MSGWRLTAGALRLRALRLVDRLRILVGRIRRAEPGVQSVCQRWRRGLPPIVAGIPDADALGASTIDTAVHLLEVALWADATRQALLAGAADLALRTVMSAMPADDVEHLGLALATTLVPAAGPACACCHRGGLALRAFGRVPGGRCERCWDAVLDGLLDGPAVEAGGLHPLGDDAANDP